MIKFELSESQVPEFRKPWAKVLSIKEVEKRLDSNLFVAVGDRVSFDFSKSKRKPDIFIVDGMEQRKKVKLKIKSRKRRRAKNKPATVSKQLWKVIKTALNETDVKIIVNGEEDLAVLPVVMLAPIGTQIVYGQPNEGVVLLRVDEALKKKCAKFFIEYYVKRGKEFFSDIKKADRAFIVHHTDADGCTSGALVVEKLQEIGLKEIETSSPKKGPVIEPNMKERLKEFNPDVLIIVDMGNENARYLKKLSKKIKICVIDHHKLFSTDFGKATLVNPHMAKAPLELKDVSEALKKSESKIIKSALKNGGIIMGIPLPGFTGLLGKEVQPNRRLGTELADYAKPHLKGIFHSDELPGYGITDSEVTALKKELGDSFAIAAGPIDKVRTGLKGAMRRAESAILGVPEETRKANEDSTTSYLRPLPGASRMYPETDVPPVRITDEILKEIKSNLPEIVDKKIKRFQKEYKIPEQMAKEVIDEGFAILFEKTIGELKLQPTIVANTFVSNIPALRRDGINVDSLSDDDLYSVFEVLSKGMISKEGVADTISKLADGKSLEDLMKSSSAMSKSDLQKIIKKIIKEKESFIKEQGPRAFAPVMGIVMKEVRGKIDGKIIAEELKKQLK
ncbi:Glu-tRNA(Gln) amidotransferase subunit GatE [Candidatus Undinarchaeota archaeon]